jgi:tetratricopeptide repeat protein/PPIC-type peptidyl-prolyl cis-trans isomerase-like protein
MFGSERFAAHFLVLVLTVAGAKAAQDHYVGAEVCAGCHRAIYDSQAKTAMANTWHGTTATLPPLKFDEGALHYEVRRDGDRLEFSVGKVRAQVNEMVGGKRHGLSFLLGLDQIDGISLERPALMEGRYASSSQGVLVLSPGFLKEKPADYEDSLGRVLSPTFERRCLTCHGQPGTLGAGKQGGVRCESCHGPASAHVNSVTARPKHLDEANSMEVCAQCHSGLSATGHADPMPEDMIVSRQVPALRKSECFIQSGEKLSCIACHNPHQDSATVVQSSVNICLRCHSLSVSQHASICPVNRTQNCIGCHMPAVVADSFRLADHWIRVHPDGGFKAQPVDPSLRSLIVPKREFLRLIVVDDREKMQMVTQRLSKGESLSSVAHELSIDASAPGGGYIGDMRLSEMDAKLAAAAAQLPYGGTSSVIEIGNNFMFLQREPRDFRWQANQLFKEASDLKDRGNLTAAVAKNQQALQVYPYLLRGLVMMATMLGQAGKVDRAAEILRFASQSYPDDASTQFDLALTLGKHPAEQIDALRRAIDLDPDMVAAYQSLGAALYATGQPQAAIEAFRRGLQIDPLSAVLYYDLGLALKEQGDSAESQKALRLAARLDPEISARNANPL